MKTSLSLLLIALTVGSLCAQSPSDRAATAQMHIAQISQGITYKQRAVESSQNSVRQAERRIADLERQKQSKPAKFGFLYDEQIRQAQGELGAAQRELNQATTALDELNRSLVKYQAELDSALRAAARNQQNSSSSPEGLSLEEALRRPPNKRRP